MSAGTFSETWLLHKCGPYELLAGHDNALVRTSPLKQGFLWQFGRKYGFSETLELAKAWVEALATHYSIQPAQRWMSL